MEIIYLVGDNNMLKICNNEIIFKKKNYNSYQNLHTATVDHRAMHVTDIVQAIIFFKENLKFKIFFAALMKLVPIKTWLAFKILTKGVIKQNFEQVHTLSLFFLLL